MPVKYRLINCEINQLIVNVHQYHGSKTAFSSHMLKQPH